MNTRPDLKGCGWFLSGKLRNARLIEAVMYSAERGVRQKLQDQDLEAIET
jgi:hypothetical protein